MTQPQIFIALKPFENNHFSLNFSRFKKFYRETNKQKKQNKSFKFSKIYLGHFRITKSESVQTGLT